MLTPASANKITLQFLFVTFILCLSEINLFNQTFDADPKAFWVPTSDKKKGYYI